MGTRVQVFRELHFSILIIVGRFSHPPHAIQSIWLASCLPFQPKARSASTQDWQQGGEVWRLWWWVIEWSDLSLKSLSKNLTYTVNVTQASVPPPQILAGCFSSTVYICTCLINSDRLCMFLLLFCKCPYLFSFVAVPFSGLYTLFLPLDFKLLEGRGHAFYFTLIP